MVENKKAVNASYPESPSNGTQTSQDVRTDPAGPLSPSQPSPSSPTSGAHGRSDGRGFGFCFIISALLPGHWRTGLNALFSCQRHMGTVEGLRDFTLDCLAWLSAAVVDQLEGWELQLNLGKAQPSSGGTKAIACVDGVNTLSAATAGAEPSSCLQQGSCWHVVLSPPG